MLKAARRESRSAWPWNQVLVVGPRWHRSPALEERPGREIQRYASAYFQAVCAVGCAPRPAFTGLQLVAFAAD